LDNTAASDPKFETTAAIRSVLSNWTGNVSSFKKQKSSQKGVSQTTRLMKMKLKKKVTVPVFISKENIQRRSVLMEESAAGSVWNGFTVWSEKSLD
jgi:hypothetical protein